MNETPASLGFRMPAEWEPQSATWLTWPHNPETWPKQGKQKIEHEFLAIVRSLSIHETIHLLVTDEMMERSVKLSLINEGVKMENIIFHDIPTNESWIRDYGPNFIVQDKNRTRKVAANDWNFDSCGIKYKW